LSGQLPPTTGYMPVACIYIFVSGQVKPIFSSISPQNPSIFLLGTPLFFITFSKKLEVLSAI
jgi:hypothetical protein